MASTITERESHTISERAVEKTAMTSDICKMMQRYAEFFNGTNWYSKKSCS